MLKNMGSYRLCCVSLAAAAALPVGCGASADRGAAEQFGRKASPQQAFDDTAFGYDTAVGYEPGDRSSAAGDEEDSGATYGAMEVSSPDATTAYVPGISPTMARACSAEEIHEMCQPATAVEPGFSVRCSVDFSRLDCDAAARQLGRTPSNPDNRLTKRLVFSGREASRVYFDCNGGHIDAGPGSYHYSTEEDVVVVASIEEGGEWSRPEDITITNCRITGGTRIKGLGWTGQSEPLQESSLNANHVQVARRLAPTRVTLDNVTLTGVGRSPLYIAPGVTHSKLVNSTVDGHSNAAAVYLDAESYANVIRDNLFNVATDSADTAGFYDRGWPVIAIDGSSHNRIVNNRFVNIYNAGIYLYRNCGEGGTIRHSTPSWNYIINNVFSFADPNWSDDSAILLGSRDYDSVYEGWLHCNDDEHDGSPYGSAISNGDFSRYNVVMQNQFVRDPLRDSLDRMISSRDWSDNSPNYIEQNTLIVDEPVDFPRPAGCFVPEVGQILLQDGESRGILSANACHDTVTCSDGLAVRHLDLNCSVTQVPFECRVEESNGGCSGRVSCPSGGTLVAAKAACNLEFGTISNAVIDTVPVNRLQVMRTSDDSGDGECYLGNNRVSRLQDVLLPIEGETQFAYGCSESDENGGDCHIKGIAYCLPPPADPWTSLQTYSSFSTWSIP